MSSFSDVYDVKLSAAAPLFVVFSFIVYSVGWIIYTFWFHPLAKYPGPRFAAISNFWYAWAWTSGRWPAILERTHAQYGDIVRTAPNDLSFRSPQAFRDIYAQPTKGRKLFPKTKYFWKTIDTPGQTHIMDVDAAQKSRDLLTPGFSPRALHNQESVIHQYADMFVETIKNLRGKGRGAVDVTDAFNWVTFDILGELAFGESFDAVKNAKTHFWTSVIIKANFIQILPGLFERLPILKLLGPFMMSKNDAGIYAMHRSLTMEKIQKRKAITDLAREDFFSHVLKGEFSDAELASHASVFMVAGATTTALTLAATTTLLAQNPHCFDKLKSEIRSSFKDSSEIDGEATARLPYLKAVLEEGLRMLPPIPWGPPRESPGETVDGQFIPAGVLVSADVRLLAQDPRNFSEPRAFKPERWMEEKHDRRLVNLAFVPGVRGCFGINMAQLEMRIVLAKLVFAFDWELEDPCVNLERQSTLYVLWELPKLNVRFSLRNF
ncbi:cytochrome P450 [Rhexocercosporidium sp. MPI-PUGE-AT-0058]|nr:cytochrome P450 [Rhexocercosporidium sp. MPI-PUGE-AT-0058]